MVLTARQARFVDEYLTDLNATQAAIRAGYSAKSAAVEGSRLLSNAKVAAVIAERQQKRAERTELTQDWVIDRLRENVERSMPAAESADVYQGAVANRALELLGKHIGMFVDRSEVEVRDLTPEQRTERVLTLLQTAKQRKVSG